MARDGITYSPDKEDELIGLMSQYMKKAGMSSKQIRYYLSYDEDFISDQLSDLPKQGSSKGVTEGSAHGYNVVKWYKKSGGDQLKLTRWLRKEAGLPNDDDIYFDDADLVYGDKTIVRDALVDPNLKFIDLLNAVAQATGGKTKRYSQGIYRENGVAEVSQQTLQSYRKKAAKQKSDALDVADRPDTDDATWVKNINIASKRKDGIAAANKRLGVGEGFPKDPNAPKLVQDRKTGKWYDPNKEFAKKMNSPEVMAQMKRMAQKEGVAEGWGTDEVTRYKNGFTVWHKKQTARPGEPEVWVYATPAGVSSDADAEMIIKKQQPLAKFPSLNMAFDAMKSGNLTSESIEENKKGVKAVKRKVASIEPGKPRNFVAKNAVNTGAGAHKDKKKAAKQGEVKHKTASYEN
jgi:hypothetical protein